VLAARFKDEALFESLAAINERFAKLQDTLGAAMRHALVLSGEPSGTFLKTLAFYEKAEVIDTAASWQRCRTARNLAAHDYETAYPEIAEHFNTLHDLRAPLYQASARFLEYCANALGVSPVGRGFTQDFLKIVRGS